MLHVTNALVVLLLLINPVLSFTPQPRVWLHLGIVGHFPGAAAQLKHYLHHYLDILGFQKEYFICAVNYRSRALAAQRELQAMLAIFNERHITCELWDDEFLAMLDLKTRIPLFHQYGITLDDWLVITDMDEYQMYPYLPAPSFLLDLDKHGYNYVQGHFVDRVTVDGSLPALRANVDIQEQFPMKCSVIASVSGGWTAKAVAAKGFWRSDDGNHYIVTSNVLARDKFFGPVGVYNITPYGQYPDCYSSLPADEESAFLLHHLVTAPDLVGGPQVCHRQLGPCGCNKYIPQRYPLDLEVHHFKWHSGVLPNLQRRLGYFRGDDIGGRARVPYFQEVENLVNHILSNDRRMRLPTINCTFWLNTTTASAHGVRSGGDAWRRRLRSVL